MDRSALDFTKKTLLVINPVAGRKLIQRSLCAVVRCLMDRGCLVTTAVTASRGEARCLCAELGEKYDLIVCAGGDGTLNECISGMADADLRRPLGYIPCGSTNDFALSHDLPLDILEAAAAVAEGRLRQYDLGCFGEQFFLHHALFGAFTRLAYSTDQNQKNVLGFGAYVLDGLRELPNLKPVSLSVTADGVIEEGEYLFGTVSVDRHIAGLYTLSEELVGPADGRLAAVLIKAPKSVPEWDVLGRSLLSGDPNCSMVKVLSGRQLLVRSSEEIEWSLDGESSGLQREVQITAKQGFLTLQG